MHRHDRDRKNDIINMAKGTVLGMLFGSVGVGIALIILIAYFKAA
jgi:hypothetical protein